MLLASNSKRPTIHFAPVRLFFLHTTLKCLIRFPQMNGYDINVSSSFFRLNAISKISKFDDQRENGTFPASLEP